MTCGEFKAEAQGVEGRTATATYALDWLNGARLLSAIPTASTAARPGDLLLDGHSRCGICQHHHPARHGRTRPQRGRQGAVAAIHSRTGALLRRQRQRGILRSVKDPKHGKFNLWEIAL